MKTFHTNCTLPSEPSFVKAPNTRGTLEIVWSCLIVLLLFTWSIQHPNLPIQVRNQTLWQSICFQSRQARSKTFHMFSAILFPEYFVYVALSERFDACFQTNQFRGLFANSHENTGNVGDPTAWSLTHSFFANMGGFQIEFSDNFASRASPALEYVETQSSVPDLELPSDLSGDEQSIGVNVDGQTEDLHALLSVPLQPYQTQSHSTYELALHPERLFENVPQHSHELDVLRAALRRYPLDYPGQLNSKFNSAFGETHWYPKLKKLTVAAYQGIDPEKSDAGRPLYLRILFLQGNLWTINAEQLLLACKLGIVALPSTTRETIMDKSKSDELVKMFAIIQALWLVVTAILRARSEFHTSSQLEIGTIAIATCMLWIHIALWHKPQNASTAIILPALRLPTPSEMREIASASKTTPAGEFELRHGVHAVWRLRVMYMGTGYGPVGDLFVVLTGVVLGAIHLFAWGYEFPSSMESTMWKIAAGVATGFPLVVYVPLNFIGRVGVDKTTYSMLTINPGWYAVCLAVAAPYLLARTYLMVEMVRSLYFLPPSAFRATWANEAPGFR